MKSSNDVKLLNEQQLWMCPFLC